jgi:hypothetical protein
MLMAAVSHPGDFPQNHVLAITAPGKKSQNGFPNEISNTSESQSATAGKRIAMPYQETWPSSKFWDSWNPMRFIAGHSLRCVVSSVS